MTGWTYTSFGVVGDELFTQQGASAKVRRWKKVSSLCEQSTSYRCHVNNCGCTLAT